jgi:hypothetical protein
MNVLVLGFIMGYGWREVEPWVASLRATGYSGDVLLYAFNMTIEEENALRTELNKYDVKLQVKNNDYVKRHTVVVERFRYISGGDVNLLKYDYVFMPDVKDVVFQTDPREFVLNNNSFLEIGYDNSNLVAVGSESLNYIHEPWGCQNIQEAFPFFFQREKRNRREFLTWTEIYNAGTMSGAPMGLEILSSQIISLCDNSPIHNPDQAALNLLIKSDFLHPDFKTYDHDDGYACQCGTTMDPNKMQAFRPHLLGPEPVFDGTNVVTSTGEPFMMVHQYDRVPILKEYYDRKYRK